MFMYGYFFFGTFGTVCYEINIQIVKDLLRGNSSNKWDADKRCLPKLVTFYVKYHNRPNWSILVVAPTLFKV